MPEKSIKMLMTLLRKLKAFLENESDSEVKRDGKRGAITL